MLAMSRPVKGREAEYNDWYQNVHLRQVLALPGFRSARRLRLVRQLVECDAQPYLAIYEIETDDIDGALQQMKDTAGSAELVISAALDAASVSASVYEPCGPVVER
jgi:hypothetical protein